MNGIPTRVHVSFSLHAQQLTDSRYLSLLNEMFLTPLNLESLKSKMRNERLTICCSPDLFAVFLIRRNKIGLYNGFKELRAELVVPPEKSCFIDATERHIGSYLREGR